MKVKSYYKIKRSKTDVTLLKRRKEMSSLLVTLIQPCVWLKVWQSWRR